MKFRPALAISLLLSLSAGLSPGPAALNCVFSGSMAMAQTSESQEFSRLDRSVIPESYRIFIEPDLENRQFSGEETIFVDVEKACDRIVLNQKELEIAEPEICRVGDSHGDWLKPEIEIDEKGDRLILKLKEKLRKGKYELRMKFAGKLNDKLVGFYYSSAKDRDGEAIALASTQMEPTDARRVFPCFDEPDMKAKFKISLSVDEKLTAISNAPLKFVKEDKRAGKHIYTFEETPRMSTYLVALIVGPLEATEAVTVNGVKIRVWATRGKKEECLYARGVAEKLLPFFEDYFGVKYPEKKLDLIAIPDFGPGAMENLGAVTFRETRLLVDDKTSTSARQSVASVVAHEMAHMWFGDLVTMKWWDDLWLNEAFATWMSVKAVDFYMPEWKVWDSFVAERSYALGTDALDSTRPIYAPVKDPAEAEEMFDEITYEKGASVLRMIETYLGEETYKKGIQAYIREFQFKNASGSDLWSALSKASGKPVGKIMEGWVETPGYPLVSIKSQGDKYKLEQDRFLLLGGKSQSTWQIPINFKTFEEGDSARIPEKGYLMTGRRTSISAASPLLVNANADGYFRTYYEPELMKELLSESVIQKLNSRERYQLLSDSWALTEAGKQPVTSYLNLTALYKKEEDPTVASLLIRQLHHLEHFLPEGDSEAEAVRERYAAFVRDRLSATAEKLGWDAREKDSDLTQILRSRLLAALGTIGQDKEVIEEARKRFSVYLSDPSQLNPNLYGAIVGIAAYNGDARDYEALLECWRNSQSAEAKIRNLMALADFRNPSLQGRTLKLSLTDEVKSQDAPHLVTHLISTTAGRYRGWDFVKANWKTMEERFPVHLFPRVIKGTTSFVTGRDAEELASFLDEHPIRAGRRVAAKVLERVKLNAMVNERSSKELIAWLKAFSG